MIDLLTPHDSLRTIARFVKETRLSQNIKMADLASRAGIGVATLARIEKSGACSTDSLVKIFAALGKLELFTNALVPEETASIAELRHLASKRRQRVRK